MITQVLLIEDEPPAAQRLRKLITGLRPDWQIEHVVDSVEDAVEWLNTHHTPHIIFMDIQLADGLSFEIFKKTKVEAPIIFTTAFNNHTLDAFKVNSVDYLLKPIDLNELEAAITKFEKTRIPAFDIQLISQLIQHNGKQSEKERKRFLVKTAGRLVFIPVEDIAFFFSDDGNTFINTRAGERFLVDYILEDIEKEISTAQFFRINRKMIVHLDSIVRIENHLNNRFLIITNPRFDEDVIVSRLRVNEFKEWLDQ